MLACKKCGGPAVEQVRGLIKPEEPGYVGMDAYNSNPRLSANGELVAPPPPGPNPAMWSSNNPSTSADTRVTCTKCDNATGWNKQDVADYTRFVWDRDHAVKS